MREEAEVLSLFPPAPHGGRRRAKMSQSPFFLFSFACRIRWLSPSSSKIVE